MGDKPEESTMQRVTKQDLEQACRVINTRAGTPQEPWTRDDKGNLHANIGNYHLSGAYGGYGLHQMCNESGGIRSIIGGYLPKKELYGKMQAFIAGMDATN